MTDKQEYLYWDWIRSVRRTKQGDHHMSIYELPDGFQGMDSLPRGETVNLVTVQGRFTNGHWDSGDPVSDVFIGWSPIVPPKKKRRFVVCEFAGGCGPYVVHDDVNIYRIAKRIPTRESAQAVADIYEQAYEGGV